MAKSPEEMKAAMIAGLPEKTGKSLAEWLAILRASGLSKHKEFMTVLKTEHGLTHGFANMIALQALNSDSHTETDTDALVAGQYARAQAAGRLEAAGSFNAMMTHRVRLSSAADVDKELVGWLKSAYAAA